MKGFVMLPSFFILFLVPASSLAEQTRNCSQLLVDTYRDAYATCQSIAARGQPPVFQNTPRPESDTIDLQCAMLLEETYR